MVDFTMPTILDERFTSRIPAQRAMVNEYFKEGKLVSYGVSLENGRVWAVFSAENDDDVKEWVKNLPLTRMMQFSIMPLTFYNMIVSRVPDFSTN